MRCPRCGFDNVEDTNFCTKCRTELEPAAPSPEGTVRNYLKAMGAGSVSGMAKCCTGQEKADTLEAGKDLFAGVDDMGISDIETEVVCQSKNKATVRATYHVKVTMGGQTKQRYRYGYADLVKVDGEWLIESSYS